MKYCVQVKRKANGWYVAVCPGLPGCLGRGHSCREAVLRIDDAIRGYVASIGDFVPETIDHELVEIPEGSDAP